VVRATDDSKKKGPETVSRTAEEPGQTLNVDLCFVPAEHEAEIKLPAVSGSSGRLVVEKVAGPTTEAADYPGQVFADETLSYTEAMLEFARRSKAKMADTSNELEQTDGDKTDLRAKKRVLHREQAVLRLKRSQLRECRRQQDQAWQQLKAQRREQHLVRKRQQLAGHKLPWGSKKAQDELWCQLRQQRQAQVQQRKQEDQVWRQQRQILCQQAAQLPLVTTWIAILVITDNCTRQCLGLPLFVAGPHVTAEMVVEALQSLLPPELLFLISDRGTHFTADIFKELSRNAEFIHVLIARHRPQSNGIAERFVRSLKEWLKDKSWHSDQQLDLLLAQFLADYNDRPHQGLPIPGLSPNEFANRIWLF
jgi:transposase InsO family protein